MRYLAAALVAVLIPLHALAQTTKPAPSAPPARNDLFGMDLGPDLDARSIARAGSGWARIPADWATLEPTRNKFAWSPLDAAIKRSTDASLRVVVVFLHTPKWAA